MNILFIPFRENKILQLIILYNNITPEGMNNLKIKKLIMTKTKSKILSLRS
jgi:hypothetical protein